MKPMASQLSVVQLNKPKPRRESMTGRSSCAPIPHYLSLRFCMFVIAKSIQNGTNVTQMRLQFCNNSTAINFISKLWKVFGAIISGALDELKTVLGDTIALAQETIDKHIQCFFAQSLQLDGEKLNQNV
jgi:hypothetical protein